MRYLNVIHSTNEVVEKNLYNIHISEGMDGCIYCGIMIVSNLCQGNAAFTFTNSYMTSLAVSDTAHTKGGNSHHHICNIIGTTSSASSSDTGQPSAAERA